MKGEENGKADGLPVGDGMEVSQGSDFRLIVELG